jgi:recombinational DNA repair ATPase RecF
MIIKIKKLSEILGKINIVLFTPDDINILKVMDQVIEEDF